MGKKLDERRLSAAEAKNIADTSEVTLTRIYKIIKEEAEEGRTRLDWSTCYLSETCKSNIIADLRENGYEVETSDCELIINW